MSPVSRETAGGRAYIDLQRRAQDRRRNTQELLQLYILEGFLVRLSHSASSRKFVLKDGVLLVAFGSRRPTRDVDLAGQDLGNSEAEIVALIKSVLEVRLPEDDGIEFDAVAVRSEIIREGDEYSGVRVSARAQVATSRHTFHVDVSVGDPIVPSPTLVSVPRLLGGEPVTLNGYPLHMVHAEKVVTAIHRGVANTRWRDFGDIWVLSRAHALGGTDLQTAIREVAQHRQAELIPLTDVLDGNPQLAQSRWRAWRNRQGRDELPEQFADLLAEGHRLRRTRDHRRSDRYELEPRRRDLAITHDGHPKKALSPMASNGRDLGVNVSRSNAASDFQSKPANGKARSDGFQSGFCVLIS